MSDASAHPLPPVVVGDSALSVVSTQRYLVVLFDILLNWYHCVAGVCKSMSYLMMNSSHPKKLAICQKLYSYKCMLARIHKQVHIMSSLGYWLKYLC